MFLTFDKNKYGIHRIFKICSFQFNNNKNLLNFISIFFLIIQSNWLSFKFEDSTYLFYN